jgi:hypothetical protein
MSSVIGGAMLLLPRQERSPAHPRGKPGFLTHEEKIPRETDSSLEESGFELPVPLLRKGMPGVADARCRTRSAGWRY